MVDLYGYKAALVNGETEGLFSEIMVFYMQVYLDLVVAQGTYQVCSQELEYF